MQFSKIREYMNSLKPGQLVYITESGWSSGQCHCFVLRHNEDSVWFQSIYFMPGEPAVFLERVKEKLTTNTEKDFYSTVLLGDQIVYVSTEHLRHYETAGE